MSHHPVSVLLADFKANLTGERVSVADLLHAFEDRSVAFFLFIFALPAAIPLPGLGINLIIAIPLLFLTFQQFIRKKELWLPKSVMEKSFKRETFEAIVDKAVPVLGKFEIFIRPRLMFITSEVGKSIIGLVGIIMALSICVPLPLTNTIPAFAIAVMSVGVITRDGLAVIVGALIGMIWVGLLTWALVFLGTEGLDIVKDAIKSFM